MKKYIFKVFLLVWAIYGSVEALVDLPEDKISPAIDVFLKNELDNSLLNQESRQAHLIINSNTTIVEDKIENITSVSPTIDREQAALLDSTNNLDSMLHNTSHSQSSSLIMNETVEINRIIVEESDEWECIEIEDDEVSVDVTLDSSPDGSNFTCSCSCLPEGFEIMVDNNSDSNFLEAVNSSTNSSPPPSSSSSSSSTINNLDKKSLNESSLGIVFNWYHLPTSRNPPSIGYGLEFFVAVRSIRDQYPEIPIYLFTNVNVTSLSLTSWQQEILEQIVVIEIDLLEEAHLTSLYRQNRDDKLVFGTKPQALLSGWKYGVLPDFVLLLDMDVIIHFQQEYHNLLTPFTALKHYDVAGVFEGYALGPKPTPAHLNGWEINTGVLAVKKSTIPLIQRWADIFRLRQDRLSLYYSGEQQALMLALEEMQDFRVFPLPNLYNFRRTTILPVQGPKMPMIVHGHIYRSQDLNPDLYHTVAEHLAVVSMEDCVMAMKLDGEPKSFLCDKIAG